MFRLIANAARFRDSIAVVSNGQSYTYDNLLASSQTLAEELLDQQDDLAETKVAFMVSPGFDYVKTQWAIWRAGGVAVPLCITYPLPSLEYVLVDTGASVILVTQEYESILSAWAKTKNVRFIVLRDTPAKSGNERTLPLIDADREAMILYTSGTTSKPKGVVTTHKNIEAQVTALVKAWRWTSADHTLCVLPLHHVHGIINVISCALWSGATVEFLHPFSAESVFATFKKGHVNVFMAVPTIYYKLISYWESLSRSEQQIISARLVKFRLMVSGSAALPVSVMEKWKTISSHTLLERYGMTEIGMGISNPYDGERRAGYIGQPISGVSVRLVDENNNVVKPNEAGEIQIKGENVFLKYWNKPDATRAAFTDDGWFKTGDVAIVENTYYRILGRDSIDIIKSGGYKISAIEIEEILRTHTDIADCSVIGIPNEEWGEVVAAVLIVRNSTLDVEKLNSWMRDRMPAYKVPRHYKVVQELPRNAMGKVTKNELKKIF